MSNTGVERTNGSISGSKVGVGYLSGTLIPEGGQVAVLELLESYLGPSEVRPVGLKWYGQSAVVGPEGSMVAWEPRGPVAEYRRAEVHVELKQSSCDRLGWDRTQELGRKLAELGLRATRFDGWVNDSERLVEPDVVLEAFKSGQVKTHLRQYDHFGRGVRGMEGEGRTVYLGSRKSEEFLRIYDKAAESGDPGAGVRWEVQARGDRAEVWFRELLVDGVDSVGEYIAEQLVRMVDFVEREPGEAHAERLPRLEWWSQLVGVIKSARKITATVSDSLARRRAWAAAAWPKTLALLVSAEGGSIEWLRELISAGMGKIGPREWDLVQRSWEEERLGLRPQLAT